MDKSIMEQFAILNQIAKQQEEIYRRIAVQLGISDTAFWVLYHLCYSDKVFTQNDLAELWYIPKQTINSAITSLIKKGYIYLEQITAARNSKAILLTDKGAAFCKKAIQPILNGEQRAFSQLTEEERKTFISLSQIQHLFLLKEFNGILENLKNGEKCVEKP